MLNGNRMKSNRKRSPRDYYQTPEELVRAAITKVHKDEEIAYRYGGIDVLDAGCGSGVWAKECTQLTYGGPEENDYPWITAIDIESHFISRPDLIDELIIDDFLTYNFRHKFDFICGNPPYSLAEEFIRRAYDLLHEDGYIYFLLRLSFLEGIKRGRGLFKEMPLKKVYVLSRRPSFFSIDGKHTTDTLAYAMFLWQKGFNQILPDLDWLDWEYEND